MTEVDTDSMFGLDLDVVSRHLERQPASGIVRWAWNVFGESTVLSASFQDCVLIDIATKVAPDIEIVFLDTQYHFDETLQFVEQVRSRYDLNLTIARPAIAPDDRWKDDQNSCCRSRKVEPLRQALDGRSAWLTGLRRDESTARESAPAVALDATQGVIKVNPLVTWSDRDVAAYIATHKLPTHPLTTAGYGSIGCWPCTRSITPGEHPRAGRWSDSDKTECGLHPPVLVDLPTRVTGELAPARR